MVAFRPNRVVSVDFWRGVALATIFVDHIPGSFVAGLTPRNFGFSDAAEIFVFLAGVAAAFAYLRHFGEGQRGHQTLKIGLRAFTLYSAHIVVLVFCGAIIAYTSLATQDPRILEMMQFDVVTRDPLPALVGIATLGFQPSSLNILPLYIVLLLMAPALIGLVRHDMRLALSASGGLYLLTQFLHLTLPSYPAPDAWFFNPLAWQFLFTLGLCCGAFMAGRRRVADSRMLIAASGLYLILSFVLVHGGFVGGYDLSPLPRFLWDQDKTNLSLPRLLHFGALVYLVSRLPISEWIRDRAPFQPLIWMGQHSLPVFSLGVVLSMVGQGLRILYGHDMAFDIFLISFGLALQIGLAWVLEWQKTGPTKKAATPAELPAARAS
ncbi:MAG: OpgC family protein [Hyphomicrobiales bacterium]